jgi:DNA-binding Lrp family transcriptional regulator
MSVLNIIAAMRSNRKSLAERLVWQCLENHANGARCWSISRAEIARELNISPDTVNNAIQALEADGIIRVELNPPHKAKYHMLFDVSPKPRSLFEDAVDESEFPTHPTRTESEFQTQRESVAESEFPTVKATAESEFPTDSIEESTSKEESTRKVVREGSARADAHDPPVVGSNVFKFETGLTKAGERERIVTAWNAIAEAGDLPVVMKMTKRRERAIDLRIAEVGFDAMCEAVRKVAASSFCHGQNERGWRADFDFLLQPTKLIATLEGRYDNRTPKAQPKPGGVASMRAKYGFRGLQPTIEPEPEGRVAL